MYVVPEPLRPKIDNELCSELDQKTGEAAGQTWQTKTFSEGELGKFGGGHCP